VAGSTVTEPLPPATDPYSYQPPPPPGPPPGAYAYQPPPPPKPRKVRERSVLGPLTFSTLLIAAGVIVIIDRTSRWDVHPAAFLAVLLGITGIGLVVGGWLGRSRGLIGLGVVLALLTALASAVPAVDSHRTGEVHWTPTSQAAVPVDGYRWAAGDVRLDLRQLAATGDATVRADLGAGTMLVTVPATTRLVIHAHVGLGSLQLPGANEDDGFGRQADVTIVPPLGGATAAPPTTLTLTLKVGVGQLEVHRAQA
jgi:hypothetical protein